MMNTSRRIEKPFGSSGFFGAHRPKEQEALPMTICAAAICQHPHRERDGKDHPSVITISDRMLSSGDIEFEPDVAKVRPLSSSIVCLFANDRDLSHTISEATRRAIDDNTSVEDAADTYASNYLALQRKRAEAKYLKPFDLTYEKFVSILADSNSNFLSALFQQILDDRLGV